MKTYLPEEAEKQHHESMVVSVPLLCRAKGVECSASQNQSSLPVSIPRIHFNQLTTIQQLKNRIDCSIIFLPEGWVFIPQSTHEALTFCYFQENNIPKLLFLPCVQGSIRFHAVSCS